MRVHACSHLCFSRWINEADRGPRLAAQPENRPRRNLVAPVCPFGEQCSRLAASALQGALDLAVGVALREVATLVALLLAFRQRELDLRAAVLEVELGRGGGQAALLHLAAQ